MPKARFSNLAHGVRLVLGAGVRGNGASSSGSPILNIDSLDNMDYGRIELMNRLIGGPLAKYFRAEVRHLDRIPAGPALYVANHSGGIMTLDSFVFGGALYRERGPEFMPYGLGHDMIDWPLTLSIPWGLTLGVVPFYIPFPAKFLMEAGAPIVFDRRGPEAASDNEYVRHCADIVEADMQNTLTRLAAEL